MWIDILYENVKNYATLNNLKLGDIEKKLGVHPGYLSRQKKNPTMSVELVLSLAKILGVRFEDLISTDLYKAKMIEESRKRIEAKIEALKKELRLYDTDSNKSATESN